MRKRVLFKVGILFIVVALSLGLYQFFKEYQAVNEEVRLRTAYYVKTGQVLNVVQKDFLEGSTVESSDTNVAEITNDGGIEAKNPGVATVTVTKPLEEMQSTLPQIDPNTLPPEEREEYEERAEEETIPQEEYEVSYNFDVVVKQPVTGVKLNVEIAHLEEGKTLQLEPLFIPDNAYNKTVSYQSFNNDVATVSETGLVTAKKSGETTVEIVTQDGGFRSTCTIMVYSKKEDNKLYVKEESFSLFTDEKVQINASVTPNSDENKKIKYQSSDTNIFTVDENGVITGKVHGQAEVIVTYENMEKRIPVTVNEVVATKLQVSPKTVHLKEGETQKIEVIVEPENALDKNVNYSSSNSSVAEVQNDTIVAKQAGTATIRVRTNNGLEDTIEVQVEAKEAPKKKEVESIKLNESTHSMYVGETYQIGYTFSPMDAEVTPPTFTSSRSSVAVVDQAGTVTAMGPGTTQITVTMGKASATMTMTVKQVTIPATSLTVSPTSIYGKVGDVIPLEVYITPENATERNIIFGTSDNSVASVSASGVVTLRKEGTAVISAHINYGPNVNINVVVEAQPTITLNKQAINLVQDATEKITATVKNSNDKEIVWSSENSNIATVDNNGNIRAVADSGSTTIVASLKSNPAIRATVVVNITAKKIAATGITVTNQNTGVNLINHLFLTVNTTTNLQIQVTPANTSDKPVVSFVSGQSTSLVNMSQNGNTVSLQSSSKTGTTKIQIQAGNVVKTIIVQVEGTGDKMYFLCKNTYTPGDTDTWVTGDAIIVRSDNEFGMVDTGRVSTNKEPNATEDVFSILNGLGIKTLDFIIISHWDSDHYGNLLPILKEYNVKKVYAKTYSHNGTPVYTYEFSKSNKLSKVKEMVEVITGKQVLEGAKNRIGNILKTPSNFTFHNMQFEVYNKDDIYKSYYDKCHKSGITCDENPQSLIYLVKVNGKKILLAGDSINLKKTITKNGKKEIVMQSNVQTNTYKKIGKVDVFKVAHHGFSSNNPKASIDLIKPKYAVFTNKESRFGSWSTNSSLGHINNAGYTNIKTYTGSNNYFTYGKVIISRFAPSKIYFAEAPATL